jgi:hypothetical protein
MTGFTYDTGALIAAERGDRDMWAMHATLIERDLVPTVPAPVLAEAWRGSARQANLARLLALGEIDDLDHAAARRVGVLAGEAGHDDVVDVAVVEGALRRDDAILTSNRTHIEKIAAAGRRRLAIIDV